MQLTLPFRHVEFNSSMMISHEHLNIWKDELQEQLEAYEVPSSIFVRNVRAKQLKGTTLMWWYLGCTTLCCTIQVDGCFNFNEDLYQLKKQLEV